MEKSDGKISGTRFLGSSQAVAALLIAVLAAIALTVSARVYNASSASSGQADASESSGWPRLPTEVEDSFWEQLGEDFRGSIDDAPKPFAFEYSVDVQQLAMTLRYGECRVGTALPWLRERSKDLWSSPSGISACIALLYFGDTTGFRSIQENIEQISRSPEHWNILLGCFNTQPTVFHEHLYEPNQVGDLTLRTVSRLPCPGELKTAVAACTDDQLEQMVQALDSIKGAQE